MEIPRIETTRLCLRPIVDEDDQAIFAIFSHPDVMRFYGSEQLQSLEAAQQLITTFRERAETGVALRWGIEWKETGQLIGTCGFHLISPIHRRAEIGYELHSDFWQRGIASEAVEAVMTYGHFQLQLHRIAAVVYVNNFSSRKLLERLGFVEEGLIRDYFYVQGQYESVVMYSHLLTDELYICSLTNDYVAATQQMLVDDKVEQFLGSEEDVRHEVAKLWDWQVERTTQCYIGILNGVVIGCAIYATADRKHATIIDLCVERAVRRRGYAQKLLRHTEREMKRHGVEVVELEVDRRNVSAVEVFKALHYTTSQLDSDNVLFIKELK